MSKPKQAGFTIVELLIVIVVIGILAAITIVAYNGIQERAKFTRVQSDLKNINTALQIYHADEGVYPVTGWRYSCSTGMTNFIPGLASISSNLPQAPCSDSANTNDTWVYSSNGVGYKLLHIRPAFSDNVKNSIPTNLRDLRWSSTGGTWGYWTKDYVSV